MSACQSPLYSMSVVFKSSIEGRRGIIRGGKERKQEVAALALESEGLPRYANLKEVKLKEVNAPVSIP